MNDRLIDILRQTDTETATPGAAADDASIEAAMFEAKRRLQRRGNLRLGAVVVGALVLVVGSQPFFERRPAASNPRAVVEHAPTRGVAAIADVERLRAEIAQLDREIAGRDAVVVRLEQCERSRRIDRRIRRVPEVSPALEARIDAESAAQTILLQGDRLAGDERTQRLAPDAYRRIIELFPESAAANDARRRLQNVPEGERV